MGKKKVAEVNQTIDPKAKMINRFKIEDRNNKIIGVILILTGLVIFVTFTIWIIIAKITNIPNESNNEIIKFVVNDSHYCLAIPLLLPFSLIFIFYFRWTSFNYFKRC